MRLWVILIATVFTIEAKAWESFIEQYRIGYTDGYEEGYRKGLEEGYRLALEDFKKLYQEKLKEYEEIEAGKLLIKESRISYPRVYITGSGRLVVTGCEVIRPVDDLLHRIPKRDFVAGNDDSSKGIDIKHVPLKPYTTLVWCGEEDRIREFSPLYYRKEGSGCFKIYFEEGRGLEVLCKLGKCLR